MRILSALTYYRPYTSGLTIYAERLARAFVERGHEATVLTTRYDSALPRSETLHGVNVVRANVLFSVSKGVISPTIGFLASKLCYTHDAIVLHLPQFDAAGIAFRGRLHGKPTVLTYHCDLQLPPTPFNQLATGVVSVMNNLSARFAHGIVAYTQDYADNSPFLRRFADKITVIPPPVSLPVSAKDASPELLVDDGSGPLIGMAARFAAEKGVEVLLDAYAKVSERYPNAKILFAGQHQDVLGEQEYIARLAPRIRELEAKRKWRFVGILPQDQMAHFFRKINVLVVPSLNSTESFGLVQIEAMMNCVPVVASDLPGVRQPIRMTGMGRVVPIGDSDALARGLLETLECQVSRTATPGTLEMFHPHHIAEKYENLFAKLAAKAPA